jgi:hypothetical protein
MKLITCGQAILGDDSNEFKKERFLRQCDIFWSTPFQSLNLVKNLIFSMGKSISFSVMVFFFHFYVVHMIDLVDLSTFCQLYFHQNLVY